jgi:hypothetical protein
MPNPAEIARLAADEKRRARIAAVAQQMRDAAQVEYDAAVAEQQSLMQSHINRLAELEQKAPAADAAHTGAVAAHAQTTAALTSASLVVSGIAADRRLATATHIEQIRDVSQRIGARMAELSVDYWMEQATARVQSEPAS